MSDYETKELLGVVNKHHKFDPLMLRLFFPHVKTFASEKVLLDEVDEHVDIAPIVSPVVGGKVNKTRGSQTRAIQPAYVKPKHEVNPNMTIKRRPGEALTGTMTPAEREDAIVAQNMEDEEKAIQQREEQMATEAVLTGKYIIDGEGYEQPIEVDFGRSAENTITLLTTARWSQQDKATYQPLDDIETWSENASGVIDILVLDGKAWSLLNSFEKFGEKLETRRGSNSTLETALKDLGKVVSYKGMVGDVAIVVYKGYYIENGAKVKYLPDNTVIMGNTGHEGVRTYGAIMDAKALREGVGETTRFPKVWTTDGDPARTYSMIQSAPLMAVLDADEFVVATVD